MAAVVGVAIADPPGAWVAAGFAASGATADVGGVRLAFTAGPADPGGVGAAAPGPRGIGRDGTAGGVVGWSLRAEGGGDPPEAVDGLPTTAAEGPPGGGPAHPNGAVAVDHVVVTSPDVDRTAAALTAAGLDLRRVRPVPGSGPLRRVQLFFRAGPTIVELVGPEDPAGGGPAAFFGLAFAVTDLDATARGLAGRISAVRPAVQPGRRIATLDHRACGISVPVAFLSARERDGAPRYEASPV